jgi:hypothetical protein
VSVLQNVPWLLEWAYRAAGSALGVARPLLHPGGAIERVFVAGEEITKGPVFDCRMCGQCILHMTGMTCPMTCPKELRNGPCGGVRPDGRCEVKPEITCVWVEAWRRSAEMPTFGDQIRLVQPPVDRRLQGTSAWINEAVGRSGAPAGWEA